MGPYQPTEYISDDEGVQGGDETAGLKRRKVVDHGHLASEKALSHKVNSHLNGKDAEDFKKLVEDRAKAIAKTEETTYETMYKVGAMESKGSADMPIEISEREQVSKVLRKAQSSVLKRQFKATLLLSSSNPTLLKTNFVAV